MHWSGTSRLCSACNCSGGQISLAREVDQFLPPPLYISAPTFGGSFRETLKEFSADLEKFQAQKVPAPERSDFQAPPSGLQHCWHTGVSFQLLGSVHPPVGSSGFALPSLEYSLLQPKDSLLCVPPVRRGQVTSIPGGHMPTSRSRSGEEPTVLLGDSQALEGLPGIALFPTRFHLSGSTQTSPVWGLPPTQSGCGIRPWTFPGETLPGPGLGAQCIGHTSAQPLVVYQTSSSTERCWRTSGHAHSPQHPAWFGQGVAC
jgi:hypothetical protein